MTAQPLLPPPLALVTGGCRRLGAHIAAHLADNGYALALHGHSDSQPDEMLSEALNRNVTTWSGFVADFVDKDAASDLMQAVVDDFGRAPDLLVNSASLFDYDDAASLSEDALEQHLRINMMVPVLLANALYKNALHKLAEKSRNPSVVNILDQRIRNPNGDQLSYTLSKQALAEATRTSAVYCAPALRVNGVAPGLTIATDDYDDDQMKRLQEMMPLESLSTPADIARAVLYLAQSANVTGQIIYVDGGAHLKSFDRDFVFLGK